MHWRKMLTLSPTKKVIKSEQAWREQLSPEVFRVTRQKGTERPFSSEMCRLFEPGLYACICCDTLLFDSGEKFESGTGWPSFTQPIATNSVAYHSEMSHGMPRIETTCNTCDAHLGHVFPDGPKPSGLRYCMNAVALQKATDSKSTAGSAQTLEAATLGGGCFWCTEALFQQLEGVHHVISGYSAGHTENPDYKSICTGRTGHAEVVQITFDPTVISYADLLRIHFATHDPTTLNQQGADRGTQYRSIILFVSDEQRQAAEQIKTEVQSLFKGSIVTEVTALERFYEAENYHQNYYQNNTRAGFCQVVINPKLAKLKALYTEKLKTT